MDIIAAYREAGTYRGAAEIAGTTHKTVKRVIARHEVGAAAPERAARGRNYDGAGRLVAERVEKTAGRSRRSGCCRRRGPRASRGRTVNFRRLVAVQKALWRRDHHRASAGGVVAGRAPGHRLGALGGLHVFCAVLAWSRFRFVRFARDERAETTLGMLAECFDVLGGVPGKVLADRMGCLKGGVVANVVVPAGHYVRFASSLRVPASFLRGRAPRVEGDRREPRRLCQAGPDDPAGPVRRPGSRQRRRSGLVRGGQRRGAQRDQRSPGRAAGNRAGTARPVCRRCGRRPAGWSPARWTGCRVSGSPRPATRCRSG